MQPDSIGHYSFTNLEKNPSSNSMAGVAESDAKNSILSTFGNSNTGFSYTAMLLYIKLCYFDGQSNKT